MPAMRAGDSEMIIKMPFVTRREHEYEMKRNQNALNHALNENYHLSAKVFKMEQASMTWEDKAEWLRENGYHLIIEALGENDFPWRASIEGENRNYAATIPKAVNMIYKQIKKPDNPGKE